jgi:thiol-disulfide isomerase/thioredoxin
MQLKKHAVKTAIWIFSFTLAFTHINASSAQDVCNLTYSLSRKMMAVDASDIYCIAKNTAKKNTLIFTFAPWCAPCRAHLPNAIKFAREHDLEFYVLLVEEENSLYADEGLQMVRNIDSTIQVAILKDAVYGIKSGGKNKQFLWEIIPAGFPKISDYSKYILLNKSGEVIMVTSYKDNEGKNWRSDSTVVQNRILPLI